MPNLENIDGLNIKSSSRISLSSGTIYATVVSGGTISGGTISGGTFYSGVTNLNQIFATTGSTFARPAYIQYGSGTSGLTGNSGFYYVTNSAGGYLVAGNYLSVGTIDPGLPFYQGVISTYSLRVGNTTNTTWYYYDTQTNFHTAPGGHRFDSILYSQSLSAVSLTAITSRATTAWVESLSAITIQSYSLSGTTDRIIQTDSGGTISASSDIIEAWLLSGATTVLLENVGNWNVTGDYIGTTITNTYKGQQHYNNNYLFIAVEDNIWRRLAFA